MTLPCYSPPRARCCCCCRLSEKMLSCKRSSFLSCSRRLYSGQADWNNRVAATSWHCTEIDVTEDSWSADLDERHIHHSEPEIGIMMARYNHRLYPSLYNLGGGHPGHATPAKFAHCSFRWNCASGLPIFRGRPAPHHPENRVKLRPPMVSLLLPLLYNRGVQILSDCRPPPRAQLLNMAFKSSAVPFATECTRHPASPLLPS